MIGIYNAQYDEEWPKHFDGLDNAIKERVAKIGSGKFSYKATIGNPASGLGLEAALSLQARMMTLQYTFSASSTGSSRQRLQAQKPSCLKKRVELYAEKASCTAASPRLTIFFTDGTQLSAGMQ